MSLVKTLVWVEELAWSVKGLLPKHEDSSLMLQDLRKIMQGVEVHFCKHSARNIPRASPGSLSCHFSQIVQPQAL